MRLLARASGLLLAGSYLDGRIDWATCGAAALEVSFQGARSAPARLGERKPCGTAAMQSSCSRLESISFVSRTA